MFTANHIIERLLKDAKDTHAYYQAEFERYDNSDDMHAAYAWGRTVEWLSSYKEEYYDWTVGA
jgi:hypothetical protein